MRLKTEPHLYLHVPSESQLKAAVLTVSDLPPLCYCLAEEPDYPFHAKLWKFLSCICSRESLVCPIPERALLHSGWQESLVFPGCAPSYPKGPLRSPATLYLKFSSIPCDDLCFLQPSTEHSSTLWREGNTLKEKEKKQTAQSCREFRPGSFLGAGVLRAGSYFWLVTTPSFIHEDSSEENPAHQFSQLREAHCFCNCNILQLLDSTDHSWQKGASSSWGWVHRGTISANSPRATSTGTSGDLLCHLWEESSALTLF